MPVVVTILLSFIGVLLSIMCFFLYRGVNKVDSIEGKLNQVLTNQASSSEVQKILVEQVEELEKSDADVAKEQIVMQIKWDLIQEDWQNMKNIILLK